MPEGTRLQVVLARAGVASRRKSEELITEGRVSVNGKTVKKLGTRVKPTDHIKVDGKLIFAQPAKAVYVMLNKPKGTLTAASDRSSRPVVNSLLRGVKQRVFPVGRLDWDTEGVLLMTNDGELAHRLMHPSYEVPRTYEAKVRGLPDSKTLERLRTGVYLEDGKSPPARVRVTSRTDVNAWLQITVTEGRNRLIKRMCQAVGHPVNKLRRSAYGGLKLSGLKPGEWRHLTTDELKRLQRATHSSKQRKKKTTQESGTQQRTQKTATKKTATKKPATKKRTQKKRTQKKRTKKR